MRKGFTVIELILAVFLASLLSLSLFSLLNQVRRAVRRVNTVIEVDMPLTGFLQQIEKDVTGMFAPASSLEEFAKQDKERTKERDPFTKLKEKKDEVKPLVTKPIEKVFYLEARKDQFFWSFITTGGIQTLDADGKIAPVPLIRRVAYLLQQDPQRPNTYRLLYRYSGNILELEPFKASNFVPSIELITGIKELTIELSVIELEKKAEKGEKSKEAGQNKEKEESPPSGGQKKETKEVTSTLSTLKEWQPQEVWDKYKTLIPAYVALTGVRLDIHGREYPFEIVQKVYSYSPYVEKEKSLFEALEEIAKQIWKTE
jgi:hypothetical protein